MVSISEIVAVLEQQQGWDRLFREIKSTSQYGLSCNIAKLQDNRSKNRYRDVSPYDHSRVKLLEGPNDYINSSLVKMEKAERQYILTQGPLPQTSGQFWQMVWEQNSKAVIMLNKIIEKETRKCDHYWPADRQQSKIYDAEGFKIDLLSETNEDKFLMREFKLTNLHNNETRSILHFHYIAWPDFGVPESPTAFLDFLAYVRSYKVLEKNFGPAIIHCSAGIGRSGTFVLVDTCLVYLEKGITFDIRDTLLEMRRFRMGLIQTPQQLRFSYFAIAECERVLLSKNHEVSNSDETDSETDNNEGDFSSPKKDNHGYGDVDDKNHDEKREGRKRHGEPNGPNNEKREKLQEENVPHEAPPFVKNSLLKSADNNNVTRKRNIEKKLVMAKKIDEIKENMKKSEQRWPWKRYVVGGLLVSIVIGIAIRRWYCS